MRGCRNGREVVAGGAGITVASQVFHRSGGKFDFVAGVEIQVGGWIQGERIAADADVAAAGGVVGGNGCTGGCLEGDVADTLGNGFAESDDNVAVDRDVDGLVGRKECADGGSGGICLNTSQGAACSDIAAIVV